MTQDNPAMAIILKNTRRALMETAIAADPAVYDLATLNKIILPVIRTTIPAEIADTLNPATARQDDRCNHADCHQCNQDGDAK